MGHSLDILLTVIYDGEEDQIDFMSEKTNLEFKIISDQTIFRCYYADYGRHNFEQSDWAGYDDKAKEVINLFKLIPWSEPEQVTLSLFYDGDVNFEFNKSYTIQESQNPTKEGDQP